MMSLPQLIAVHVTADRAVVLVPYNGEKCEAKWMWKLTRLHSCHFACLSGEVLHGPIQGHHELQVLSSLHFKIKTR